MCVCGVLNNSCPRTKPLRTPCFNNFPIRGFSCSICKLHCYSLLPIKKRGSKPIQKDSSNTIKLKFVY